MAAGAGLLVDGVKMAAFLQELSALIAEAIARDEQPRMQAYEPGGRLHVPLSKAGERTEDERWNRWVPFIGRARRMLGVEDHSRLMGRGVVNALSPRGHGADPRRKLGIDSRVWLEEVMADEGARERLKRAIEAVERPEDHNRACVTRKRACNATYDMIDAYRSLFLVKHPSRGTMLAESKRLLAYLYANVISAGERWATGEEVEQLRLRASRAAAEAADAAEAKEKANAPWLAYSAEVRKAALVEADARKMPRRLWMKIAGEWWKDSPRNPKTTSSRPVDEEPLDEDGNSPMRDSERGERSTGDEAEGEGAGASPMDVEVDPRPPDPTPAPRKPADDPQGGEEWALGGLLHVEIKTVNAPRVLPTNQGATNPTGTQGGRGGNSKRRKTAPPPVTDTGIPPPPSSANPRAEKVTIAYILEILKTQTSEWRSDVHGRFGLAAFAELVPAAATLSACERCICSCARTRTRLRRAVDSCGHAGHARWSCTRR
jgi:hypothetical protein